jgi:hypothetical protein
MFNQGYLCIDCKTSKFFDSKNLLSHSISFVGNKYKTNIFKFVKDYLARLSFKDSLYNSYKNDGKFMKFSKNVVFCSRKKMIKITFEENEVLEDCDICLSINIYDIPLT